MQYISSDRLERIQKNSEMGGQDTCHMDITYFTENSLKIVLGNFTDQGREWRGPSTNFKIHLNVTIFLSHVW